ncbi:MAG: DUF1080 domain-containing protein [Verrucomicrobiota bacterium]
MKHSRLLSPFGSLASLLTTGTLPLAALTAAFCFPTLSIQAEPPTSQPTLPTERIELFDGTTFNGWVSCLASLEKSVIKPGENIWTLAGAEASAHRLESQKTWMIKDGILSCSGSPNGFLRTEKAYANYKLTVEWRFTKPGNTGVLVHLNEPDKIWPRGVECQGMHKFQGDMYFWSGSSCRELTQGPKVPMKTASSEKPAGEWNTYQVIAAEDTLTILVNGTEMNKATQCSPKSGTIGLQSEGAAFEVRKVTLEPLDK